MRLKFPDLTGIHCQFENPDKIRGRAKEISEMATKLIKSIERPQLFTKLKDRFLEIWRA